MIDFINRPYIDRIKLFIGKSLIKVLVGQQGVGKGYFLMQLKELINAQEPDTQIAYINKEQGEFSLIKSSDDLLDFLRENVDSNGKVALFIDEIKGIESFEVALRDLATRKNWLYVALWEPRKPLPTLRWLWLWPPLAGLFTERCSAYHIALTGGEAVASPFCFLGFVVVVIKNEYISATLKLLR